MARVPVRADQGGQSALFDGFLFFVIMILASVLVLASATLVLPERKFAAGNELIVFTHEARDAYMSSTIPAATYQSLAGTEVSLYNLSILDLLLVELSLIDDGLQQQSFQGTLGRVNDATLAVGERLIGDLRLHFAVFARFGAHQVNLFSEGVEGIDSIPLDRFTSGLRVSLEAVGKGGVASVDLYVWP